MTRLEEIAQHAESHQRHGGCVCQTVELAWLLARVSWLFARVAELVLFADHLPGCSHTGTVVLGSPAMLAPCSCGLDAALAKEPPA